MKTRKIPMRRCTGCQEMKNKRELSRIVRDPEGMLSVDFSGKKSGRGAYICANPECLEKAIKTKGLERSLQVAISPELVDILRNEMKAGE